MAELKNALNADPLLIEIKSYSVTENDNYPEGELGVASTHFKFNLFRKKVFDYVFKNASLDTSITNSIKKLAVSDSIETYFKNPNNSNGDNAYGRALSLGYFLEHYAFITDMLWHYSDQVYVNSLKDSLAVITAFADSVLRVSEPYGNPASHPPDFPDWPRTEYHNIRLRLIGALGYAGCILDSGRYVAYADSQLFHYSSGRYLFNGYLNFGRGNGGYYKEGQSYFSFSMHGLTLFFAAHNRMHGINHFNTPSVLDMVDRSLNLIGPDFYNIPIDDCWKTYFRWQGNSNGYLRSPNFNYGCYEFFQQSTQATPGLLDDISWYIKNYHSQFSSSGIFTVYDRIPMIISYNGKDVLNHHPTPHIPPARYKKSIESDEELTIIRESGIRDLSDYRNSLNLVINHENSYHGLVHEQDDQGSFQLYYRGKHLLIDPGYQSGAWDHHGRDWLNSAYAHNLPLIKPDASNEQENLDTDYKLPISTNVTKIEKIPPLGVTNIHSGTWGNAEYNAVRTYFSETSSIKEMQIELNYDNIENDDYLLKRNFFLLDNKFVIVRDYFTKYSGSSQNMNPVWNQLHFRPDCTLTPNPNPQAFYDLGNGIFKFNSGDISLYGANGADNAFTCALKDSLPVGLYGAGVSPTLSFYPFHHKRFTAISDIDSSLQFLSVLFPHEGSLSQNPITFVDSVQKKYVVRVDSPFTTYYAVSKDSAHFTAAGGDTIRFCAKFLPVFNCKTTLSEKYC